MRVCSYFAGRRAGAVRNTRARVGSGFCSWVQTVWQENPTHISCPGYCKPRLPRTFYFLAFGGEQLMVLPGALFIEYVHVFLLTIYS